MLPLHTTLLTTEELTTVFQRLSAIWTPLLAAQPLLVKINEAAEANRAAIVKAASRKTTSDFTQPLKDGDELRDAAFVTLRDFISTWVKSPIATAEQQGAAARLQQIIDRHGKSIHRLGYAVETAAMEKLIADLESAEATADLATLSFTPLFERMVQDHRAFEAIVADKTAVEGGADLPTVSEHRPLLERRLNLLLDNLESWLELDPTPALTAAAGPIDEAIVQIMPPALARRTRARNAGEPDAGSPAPQN